MARYYGRYLSSYSFLQNAWPSTATSTQPLAATQNPLCTGSLPELTDAKEYLKGEDIENIYFGGGTPSQLEKEDFEQIFDTIREHYGLNHCQEHHSGKLIRMIYRRKSGNAFLTSFQPPSAW
jgi:hypothetical protein